MGYELLRIWRELGKNASGPLILELVLIKNNHMKRNSTSLTALVISVL